MLLSCLDFAGLGLQLSLLRKLVMLVITRKKTKITRRKRENGKRKRTRIKTESNQKRRLRKKKRERVLQSKRRMIGKDITTKTDPGK